MKQRGLGFFPQGILIISTPYRDINRALKLFGSPPKPVALAESDLPGQLGHASGCPQSRYFHPDPFASPSRAPVTLDVFWGFSWKPYIGLSPQNETPLLTDSQSLAASARAPC